MKLSHPRGSHWGDTQANADWLRSETLLTLWLLAVLLSLARTSGVKSKVVVVIREGHIGATHKPTPIGPDWKLY